VARMIHRALFSTTLAALAVAIAAGSPAKADDAAALIAKHRAYVGWAAGDGTLKTAKYTLAYPAATPKPDATPDPLGAANRRSVSVRRGLQYRTTLASYGQPQSEEGFTGTVFWLANANGYTVTRRGRVARTAFTNNLIEAEALGDVPATSRPDAKFGGKDAAVVRIAPRDGLPADLYLDRATGSMLGYTVSPDEHSERETVHIVSYAEFAPGKRYVSAYRYGESERTFRVTGFEANAALTDGDLHPPDPQPHWTFGEPRSVPISIALHGQSGRAVVLAASVNGHVGHFLLDSGAGGIILFDPFAKGAGVKDLARTAYSGVNAGFVAAAQGHIDTLSIGGNILHDAFVTHSTSGMLDLDGIIGFDMLADSIVNVDLVAKTLSIREPTGFEAKPAQGAYAFAIDMSNFHAGVPVKVNDTVLNAWLDTGNDFFVILPHQLENRMVALTNTISLGGGVEVADRRRFRGVDGSAEAPSRCVRLNEIQVGPYRYQKAAACFAANAVFDPDGGLLGFDFLQHFNWTFDYPHGKIVLTPNGT
jgi:predicted aspartyl protease